jgi:hypothetical protein
LDRLRLPHKPAQHTSRHQQINSSLHRLIPPPGFPRADRTEPRCPVPAARCPVVCYAQTSERTPLQRHPIPA